MTIDYTFNIRGKTINYYSVIILMSYCLEIGIPQGYTLMTLFSILHVLLYRHNNKHEKLVWFYYKFHVFRYYNIVTDEN